MNVQPLGHHVAVRLAAAAIIFCPIAPSLAQELASEPSPAAVILAGCQERDAPECDPCRIRTNCRCEPGTLFQWSYGNSFAGGPNLDEPLVTDRPDFTESSSTVGRGVLQLESGYTYTFDQAEGMSVRSHSYPEALFRYGILFEWLELRVFWNYAEETTRAGGATRQLSGGEDLGLGFKIGLTPQEGILPEMALIPQMTVPTGEPGLSADDVLGGLIWIYSWDLNETLSTAGQTQYNAAVDSETGNSYGEFSQSWTVGASLTERLGSYAEWYCLIPHSADTELPQHYFNGGFTFLVNNNLQLDIRAGAGLNEAADDYFLGSGFSQRF